MRTRPGELGPLGWWYARHYVPGIGKADKFVASVTRDLGYDQVGDAGAAGG